MTQSRKTIKYVLCGKTKIDDEVKSFIKNFNFKPLINKCNFCKGKYTKDLIYQCSDFSLYLIYWPVNSYSPPHNHPDGGCILKILEGEIVEKNYKLEEDNKAFYLNERTLTKDMVGIKYGNQLHSMTPEVDTVSAHIYFPGDYAPDYFEIDCDGCG